MSDQNMEPKVKELMELRRMKEELEAEITTLEDPIKARMGNKETLLALERSRSVGPPTPPAVLTAPALGRTTRSLRRPTPNRLPRAASPSTKSRSTYHSTPAMPPETSHRTGEQGHSTTIALLPTSKGAGNMDIYREITDRIITQMEQGHHSVEETVDRARPSHQLRYRQALFATESNAAGPPR